MATRKQVEEAAADVGLYVAYYNPGDGARWKFSLVPRDYFALSDSETLGRVYGPAGLAMMWISGFIAGRAVSRSDRVDAEMERRRIRAESTLLRRGRR
ncbi:MAG: hypothetical protein WC729_29965 [Sphingomonas sp.]|jgi:hypothetical protein|uniref:hypothetical protein n=1 Tax=Sphingomonas sp. TaxID=28214 RepID=UPI003564F260